MLGGLGGGGLRFFFLLILAAGRWETAFDFWLLLLRSALRNGFGEKREGRRPGFNRGGSMGGLGGGKGGGRNRMDRKRDALYGRTSNYGANKALMGIFVLGRRSGL